MNDQTVSVVVPTRNNERTIRACLQSVRDQTHPAIELIVVDNSSTDATAETARQLADVVVTAGPERSAQRNTGLALATGRWFLWLDSDMILPPDTVSAAVETAEVTGAAGIALPERTIGDGFWTACRALERSCYLDDPWLHNPRLLRRDYLQDLGGFDVEMSGPEDADLRLRILGRGEKIALAPVVVDHDEGRLTVSEVMRKRYYYGRSIPEFASHHGGDGVRRQGAAVLGSYVRHRGRLAASPHHAVGMLALRTMEAAAYAVGALSTERERRSSARRET